MSSDKDELVQCNAADFFFDTGRFTREELAPVEVKNNKVVPAPARAETRHTPREQFIRAVQEYLALLQNEQPVPSAGQLIKTLSLMQTKIKFLGMDATGQRKIHFSVAIIDDFTAILRAACGGTVEKSYLETIKEVRDRFHEQFKKNLPQEIKMLLAELQVPFLKIAFIDRNLLHKGVFPGNNLFNALVYLGENIAADRIIEHPAFKECAQALQYILDNFDSDITVFTEMMKAAPTLHRHLEEGRSGSGKQGSVARQEPAPAAKPADARGKSGAADKINYLLEKNIKGKKLPTKVVHFLYDTWQEVLLAIEKRQGEASPEFRQAVELLEGLTWISDMQLALKDGKAIKEMFAEIWVKLDDGLREIGMRGKNKEQICKMMLDLFVDKMVS